MRKIHSYLKADIQYPSFKLVPDPENTITGYTSKWVNNLTKYKKNAVPGIKYGLVDIDIDNDITENRIRIFMGDKTVDMDYCIVGIIKLEPDETQSILHVECFNYYESFVFPRWIVKFESDNSIEHEQEKTGLQIFIDYIRENYPSIRKIELSNNRAIYFNDKNANNKYVSISPTSLCLLTYNMDYFVDIEGFTCDNYNLVSLHNKIIKFNTVNFFEYLKHYKFEDSYTNIIRPLLTKCEYIGLNEIQTIIYILFKKGYYDWLDNIVSYIAIENRLQRDYNIDYKLEL